MLHDLDLLDSIKIVDMYNGSQYQNYTSMINNRLASVPVYISMKTGKYSIGHKELQRIIEDLE
jgi:hypothetical protein